MGWVRFPPVHLPDLVVCRFVPTDQHDAFSYHKRLAGRWDVDAPLINIEWDMQYSLRLIRDLLVCPHPLCTHAYLIYEPTTHEREPHYAHSTMPRGMGGWIEQGVEWAVWSGIGFCKIEPEARVSPLRREPWMGVETSVNEAVRGPWHVHWGSDGEGIDHYHR